MKRLLGILLGTLILISGTTAVFALDFGTGITVADKAYDNSNSWYGNHEDQEVERGCATGQAWDLEGFFLKGTKLSMVGGYDFVGGAMGSNGENFDPGDLFLDINGDIKYGDPKVSGLPVGTTSGVKPIFNVFGYDYVLDLNMATMTYDIYQIGANAQLESVYFRQNDTAGAWRYNAASQTGTLLGSGTMTYQTGLSDATILAATGANLAGGSHNVLTLDLGFLQSTQDVWFTAKYTMECGNDDLIGQGKIAAPEPGTLILLGGGLLSLFAVLRKRMC